MKILVTGGCGFIGSNFIRFMLDRYPAYTLVNLDKLTYAGNQDNLREFNGREQYVFMHGDVNNPADVAVALEGVQWVVHCAAESHVDRSITDPAVFVRTNVVGTYNLLAASHEKGIEKFLHISTDEVYGSLGPRGKFSEDSPLAPNSPYAASKAAADFLARSFHATYGFPVVITRSSNNYGPYQFPEKIIPLMITNALANKPLPVYGDGLNIRDWIHVEDHCRALDVILHKGRVGEVYNIGSNNEWKNIDLVKVILKDLKKPASLIQFVPDRPGHDRRYAMNADTLKRELGWKPQVDFQAGLRKTIQWYVDHSDWIERIQSGAYRAGLAE